MSGDDRSRQHAEARLWLVKAEEDIDIARTVLTMDPPRAGGAAFHVQQAAEKLLKALLTADGTPFRKTHSLNELGEQVVQQRPDLHQVVDALRPYTTWNFAFRYPSLADDQTIEPSVDEITSRLNDVDRLLAAARAIVAS